MSQPRVLIVEARFYPAIADAMVDGAMTALTDAGAEVDRIEVPGVFELPAAIAQASQGADSGSGPRYDGYVAIGCVIRGETDHYDHVCRESSRALMDLTTRDGVALGFGVLTCDTMAQAEARADTARRNKGAEAAKACLAMVELKSHFRGGDL